jgi:hypothetical protein
MGENKERKEEEEEGEIVVGRREEATVGRRGRERGEREENDI